MAPSGIELATFRLVAQYLNQKRDGIKSHDREIGVVKARGITLFLYTLSS
jgi:chromosomal replication initiation ATPase DnaA